MKTYSVYFKEEVPYTYNRDCWNNETKKWEVREVTEMVKYKTFYDLSSAKKFIKANIDKYESSCITKTWANGDWENLGEIKLSGSNKHFVANTRQKSASYA